MVTDASPKTFQDTVGQCVRKYVRWCWKHLCNIHTCKCAGAQDTCLVPIPTTTIADTTAHAHLCNGAATLLTRKLLQTIFVAMETIANYLESCASILQAVVCRACCPDAQSPDDCPLKKTIQIHASSWRGRGCVVGQASSDHQTLVRPHPAGLWLLSTRRVHGFWSFEWVIFFEALILSISWCLAWSPNRNILTIAFHTDEFNESDDSNQLMMSACAHPAASVDATLYADVKIPV